MLICSACAKVDLTYTVSQGDNVFRPVVPTLPFGKHVFECTVIVGYDWFMGPLTYPAGYGCKLNCIGKWNYHEGGCNFAISYSDGKCYLTSRYYEPITDGYYKLHEGLSKTEMFPNLAITYKIEFSDSTRFYVRGQLVATVMPLPHQWITPPFLGRSGNDNNYQADPIPGAFAQRDLRLIITTYHP